MAKLFLQRALLVLGVLVNIAFLFIAITPDRPHLAKRRQFKILLRADPPRAQWIKDNELAEFAKAHDVEFDVVTARSFEEVLSVLQAEKDKPTRMLLASIDAEIAEELRRQAAVRPMADAVPPPVLSHAADEYIPEALALGLDADKKIWFIPRRAEIDIAVYLAPAVEDAFLHWEQDRAAISSVLAEVNHVGLPKDYSFEKDPAAWNSYDLFVAAWYWAHHPASWSDSKSEVAPRVALRTGPNEDAVHDLLSSFYRHGLTDAQVGKTDVAPVIDALQWQALFRKHHLLAPACEAPKGIDSDGVNDLFKARRLAWAPINQEDSLWLHGGAQRDAERGLPSSHELAWAALPSGASLEQIRGQPARVGKTHSFFRTQFWALPLHSPDPALGFELASFLTQRGLQQRETEAQGLLPIRKDLRADYPILFRLAWMQRILDSSYRQVSVGSGVLPPEIGAKEYDVMYTKLRARVVEGQPASVPLTFAAIQAAVREASNGK